MSDMQQPPARAIDQYKQAMPGELVDREKLVTENIGLVHHVLGKLSSYLPPNLDYEDLVQQGLMGLVEAANLYDTTKDIRFSTYAYIRVRGAIIDVLRSQGWGSRSGAVKTTLFEETFNDMTKQLGREPTMEELAEALGIDMDELQYVLSTKALPYCVSLESMGTDPKKEQLTAHDQMELEEEKNFLIEIINQLTEQERLVLTLYYYEDLRLKEIASIFAVTESRISQIHREVIFKLKAKMKSKFGHIGR
jgi:RNA polymerase sigma factor for flagellar operon FliA